MGKKKKNGVSMKIDGEFKDVGHRQREGR